MERTASVLTRRSRRPLTGELMSKPSRRVESLIAGGPGDVDLAGGGVVRQNAGQERQGVADVARGGIGDFDNLLRGQFLRGGSLSGVNHRRGINHLHGLLVLLLVRKSDIDGFRLSHLRGAFNWA